MDTPNEKPDSIYGMHCWECKGGLYAEPFSSWQLSKQLFCHETTVTLCLKELLICVFTAATMGWCRITRRIKTFIYLYLTYKSRCFVLTVNHSNSILIIDS